MSGRNYDLLYSIVGRNFRTGLVKMVHEGVRGGKGLEPGHFFYLLLKKYPLQGKKVMIIPAFGVLHSSVLLYTIIHLK